MNPSRSRQSHCLLRQSPSLLPARDVIAMTGSRCESSVRNQVKRKQQRPGPTQFRCDIWRYETPLTAYKPCNSWSINSPIRHLRSAEFRAINLNFTSHLRRPFPRIVQYASCLAAHVGLTTNRPFTWRGCPMYYVRRPNRRKPGRRTFRRDSYNLPLVVHSPLMWWQPDEQMNTEPSLDGRAPTINWTDGQAQSVHS